MAGKTGKMTREQIAARGRRSVLFCLPGKGFFIGKLGEPPFTEAHVDRLHELGIYTYARSYTLGYLLRIARAIGGKA